MTVELFDVVFIDYSLPPQINRTDLLTGVAQLTTDSESRLIVLLALFRV